MITGAGLTLALVLATGVLVTGGLIALVVAFVPRTPVLADVVGGLFDEPVSEPVAVSPEGAGRTYRLGAWLARRTPVPLTRRQRRDLELRGIPVAEFYADKAVLAVAGVIMPAVLVGCWALLSGTLPVAVPVLVPLLGGVVGFFVPDLQLRARAKDSRTDAGAALLTYIDLVTLERLANASATQALHNAANLSEAPVFRQIRAALERARLEQQSPFVELRRVAERLDLPQLADLADVMQLDESGAALSAALRARVKELRDAHLATQQREANAVSEGMTVFMALPALVFGLIFLVPPLLRIVGS
ncbi:Flp pilus assembly protein TadB [Friedmanniella endophytica]|uniref:Flp pilus assembly protein TadB n=1 Tax=Microlunatus kandeliicorticis TaxID=1759536 RepID=A0A7W3IQX5_9ACTN|nr:hypothetical protein [Microlunatus kandeliicorticis]MBA8793597.1 Flp pilus assembly protein TadB [Microlunatus kandeliicorticis]